MNYENCAKEIYEKIGGKSNIVSAAHCATRLRLVVADETICDQKKIENIDGVKGVFKASGQLQIILGTGTVNKVYDEFVKIGGITEASKDDVKKAAAKKQNWFKRAIKTLGDIFVPIIPAIVASGLLMGLLEGLCNVYPSLAESGTYTIIHLFSNAAFVFLPILIAISAAKAFGGNQYLGAVIGMIMIHSDLMSAWAVAGADSVPTASVWFGLYDINLVGYQGHVIPVVIAVWFMSTLEKKLHKIVPEIIDLFVTPLVTVLVTGYLTLTIFGPVFSFIENGVLDGVKFLITLPMGLGACLAGAVYAPTVVAGVHHMYNALEAGMISADGINTWMPIATSANVAQGAACLAVAIKSKKSKTKAIALPASLSAFLGITEPAIFGVNLRYFKPFIAGCIGGAAGALFAGMTHIAATAYGITGLFGFLITTKYALYYLIMMLIAAGVAFAISFVLHKDDEDEEETVAPIEETKEITIENDTTEVTAGTVKTIPSPLEGEAIPMEKVNDPTFAASALGNGVAVVPTVGKVVSPVDGVISAFFPTGHAIGLTTDDGLELLIHVGINTVELEGKFYSPKAAQGDRVTKGQTILEFDIDGIKKAGYDVTTPVIVANTFDYSKVEMVKSGTIKCMEDAITVEK